jgi:K+-sensing histidine kinase KdpD
MPPPFLENGATGNAASLGGSRAVFIFTGCLLLLLVVGWVDYITGYELGFFVFYTAPIGLAAWYLGRWPGIWMALGATIAWWLADALAGAKYSSRFSFWWNSTVHFSAFVINAVTIAKIRLDLRQRHKLAAKLEAARQTLRAAAKALPACPLCGKVHPQTERNLQAELRDLARDNADLSGALCEECAHPRGADEDAASPGSP